MTKNHLIHLLELGHHILYTTDYLDNHIFIGHTEIENTINNTVDRYFITTKGQSIPFGLVRYYDSDFKIVTRAPKLLPVGTKVIVLENCPYTVYRGKEMIIEDVGKFSFEYRLSDCFHNIPHWAVAPIEEMECDSTTSHKYQEVIDLIENLPSVAVDSTKHILVESKETLLERIKNLK